MSAHNIRICLTYPDNSFGEGNFSSVNKAIKYLEEIRDNEPPSGWNDFSSLKSVLVENKYYLLAVKYPEQNSKFYVYIAKFLSKKWITNDSIYLKENIKIIGWLPAPPGMN